MKNYKEICFDWSETHDAIEELIEILKSKGCHVYNISESNGSTFTHLIISGITLSKKQLYEIKKEKGLI